MTKNLLIPGALVLVLLGGRIAWVKWQEAVEDEEFRDAIAAFVRDAVPVRLTAHEPASGKEIDLAADHPPLVAAILVGSGSTPCLCSAGRRQL